MSKKPSETATPAAAPSTKTKSSVDPSQIAYCKIHPGLGIARVGDSPDEFFIGPEVPGHPPEPVGGFKDKHGRIKRQAARFRIYAYNEAGEAISELTAADADIAWTVQLANKKPSFDMFLGRYWELQFPDVKKYADEHNGGNAPLRNQELTDPDQRKRYLEIKPDARKISGVNEHGDKYHMVGTFGPLPYTVVNADTRDALAGSRSGFLNVPFIDPTEPDLTKGFIESAAQHKWKPGVMQQPIANSPVADVYLGEVRTDAHGRLCVLGGFGKSESLIPDNDVGYLNGDLYFGSNDYWYDDTSDGVVAAEVTLKDGRKVEVREKSWVLVTPPKFAPHVQPITTLWDVSVNVAAKKAGAIVPAEVSFVNEIYPILKSLNEYQWVNQFALQQHGSGMVFDPLSEPLFGQLHEKGDTPATTDANAGMRKHVFSRVRKPLPVLQVEHPDMTLDQLLESPFANEYSGMMWMPQMWGDGGDGLDPVGKPVASGTNWTNPGGNVPGGTYVTWATLTPRQYEAMRLWSDGQFVDDWPKRTPAVSGPRSPVLARIPVKDQPRALDQGSLEPCIGAPFYPGIEITYICEEPNTWAELGRLEWRQLQPGDITRYMALPWQADFSECNHRWWPAARPDDVVDQAQYESVVKFYDEKLDGPLAGAVAGRVAWARGIPDQSPGLDNGMVQHWSEFGFVVPREAHGQVVYVEEERDKYAGTSNRDAFYYLMNIGAYSDFLPHAQKMVDAFLAQAKKNASDPETASTQQFTGWNYFAYTPEAFDARMQNIYAQYVLQNSQAASGPNGYLEGTTYEQQAYRILQSAPFNQLDGAWIRQAAPPGPVDQVRNYLFQIYMDELGDAIDAHNHANVYTELLQSLNFYLPDLHSYDYAHNPDLLDSAFVEPVFLLAISSFTEQYLPEILGMTLYLEWSSVGLAGTVAGLESVGIDPAYYRLHVGIDNASAGHGALAKKAIELYLDNVRAQGGDMAMQAAFERIWTGYVAFGTLGTLGQDISEHFASPPSLSDRMVAMIQAKAEYARQNHGTKQLGPNLMNDWFDDPDGLLDELVVAGYIIPGKPDASPIFELMSFTGPMFHVFTDDEQALWHQYIVSLAPPEKFPPFDIERAMGWVVDMLRQRQAGTPGHQARLTGYDPTAKTVVTMPISWWFEDHWGAENNFVFLGALRNPINGWIVPGNAAASPLLTQLLAGNGDMAQAFREYVPEQVASDAPNPGPYTCKQVLAMWTDQGCPIHGVIDDSLKMKKQEGAAKARLRVKDSSGKPEAPATELPAKPAMVVRPKRIYGMGLPH